MIANVLLTGATGYIGGRLLRRFEADGLAVRCLVRDAARLRPTSFAGMLAGIATHAAGETTR